MADKLVRELSLKEAAINIPNQTAITNDNVYLNVDAVLYVKIEDAERAQYGIENLEYAVTQLAQTTMRSELGKITLDKTFAERETLNTNIVEQINRASGPWGIKSLRYEIRDISPPTSVKLAMDLQAEAERKKRAAILTSEGDRQAQINKAEGQRQSVVLAARGEARSTVVRAKATAKGVRLVARAVKTGGGKEAVSLRVAEQYVKAWGRVAKKGTTILLPADVNNPAAMIASAFGIYKNVLQDRHGDDNASGDSEDRLESESESETESESEYQNKDQADPKKTKNLLDDNLPRPIDLNQPLDK